MNQGKSPTTIARILGVYRTSLDRWRKMTQAAPDGLVARSHPIRDPASASPPSNFGDWKSF